jgi:hypothetical protein
VKLSQELSEPGGLSHAVSNNPVLRLSTQAWLSALKRETTGCRLNDQEIRLPLRKTA